MTNATTASQPNETKSFRLKDGLIGILIIAILLLYWEVRQLRSQNEAAAATISRLNAQIDAAAPAVSATAGTVEHAAKTSNRVLGLFDQVLDQVEGKAKTK